MEIKDLRLEDEKSGNHWSISSTPDRFVFSSSKRQDDIVLEGKQALVANVSLALVFLVLLALIMGAFASLSWALIEALAALAGVLL